jgi:hypothetical protein
MNTQHAKSRCCHVKILRFGHRRRQCRRCKRTWTIRPRKRGRRRIRTPHSLLRQVFLQRFTLQHLAPRRPRVALANFRYRFREALRHFVNDHRSPKVPRGSLTVLADGLRFHFHKRPWVLYLVAVKACAGKIAVFFDPWLFPGKEGAFRWERIFSALPANVQHRSVALIVDNLNGMKRIAKKHSWILQLCHFHLLQKLQVQWKRPRRALKGGVIREELYQLVRQALETSNQNKLDQVLACLEQLASTDIVTQRLQAVLRDFLLSVNFYRSYQKHPELNLPATTNTVESMACVIRDMLRRTRCASNPRALLCWSTALVRLRPTITCNGKIINRIS